MCTLMTLITTTFLHLAVHNYTCTIAQPISTIATCILLTYMLPKEIETLTCNKSWLKHCISRYKTAVSGRATLCKHDNRWLSILASLLESVSVQLFSALEGSHRDNPLKDLSVGRDTGQGLISGTFPGRSGRLATMDWPISLWKWVALTINWPCREVERSVNKWSTLLPYHVILCNTYIIHMYHILANTHTRSGGHHGHVLVLTTDYCAQQSPIICCKQRNWSGLILVMEFEEIYQQ